MSKVFLALSGGVDSTVAALLLKEQGFDVTGLFMRHPWQVGTDEEDAAQIAHTLGIHFRVVDLSKPFQKVVDYFTEEYLLGRTPNPCAFCNQLIKFGKLFDELDVHGADFLATGHYIRCLTHQDWWDEQKGNCDSSLFRDTEPIFPAICCGKDPGKDQSYIMFSVHRGRLSRLLFPVGNYTKKEIREIATKAGFDFSSKKESQEICFVPDQEHVNFIRQQKPGFNTSGNIVTVDGKVVASHEGFEQFTIGQRKGMRIGLGDRRYVTKIDANTHEVFIGDREDLKQKELTVSRANWLITPPKKPFRAHVKIRYRSPATSAMVTPLENDCMAVEFDEPREAIAPGQVAACYLDERIIGGGWID